MNDLRKAAQMALEALIWHDETVRTRADSAAITALRAALAQPEPITPPKIKTDKAEQEMAERVRFNVDIEGHSRSEFDSADEALRFAMGHVYLSPSDFESGREILASGRVFSYCYGFSGVNIVPRVRP